MIFRTKSPRETESAAAKIAEAAVGKKTQAAVVIGLSGELGSGKTRFAKGFIRACGIKKPVTSPTFVLAKRYVAKDKKTIFHIDAYRVKSMKELSHFGFEEMISDSENIVLIEWPERIASALPKNTRMVSFSHGKKEGERVIRADIKRK